MSSDLPATEPVITVRRGLVLNPRALVTRLRTDPMLRNSAIYLVGSTLAGLLGYVFHFETGHLLGPSGYSVVASAIAALYVLNLPLIGLQLASARYASIAAAREQLHAVAPMLMRLTALSLLAGLPVVAVLVIFANEFARFLNLSDVRIVYLLAGAELIGLVVTVNRGALQGLRRFVSLSANMVVDMTGRLVAAGAFVLSGLGPLGALAALLVGPAIAYGQSFVALRPRTASQGPIDKIEGLGSYAALATVASVGVNYLFSIDTLLAKHFLTADAAGVYAAAAVLARVVYFLGLSVSSVMFPEVATLHARNEGHFHVVDLALLMVGTMGVALIAAYSLFPGLVLLPYGPSFVPARSYLGVFALALTLLAIANLLINYLLSIARRSFVIPLFGACILETLLISLFHSSIWQILTMVVITLGALAGALGMMYVSDRVVARRVVV